MKTFYSLLSLCLIVPTLLFSENWFKKNCNDHRQEAKAAMENETALMKEARNTHPDQIDQLLSCLRNALGEATLAKEKLEQILRILSQREAKDNLSKKQINEWKEESEHLLKERNEHIKNLHEEIAAAIAWKETADIFLKGLKTTKTQKTGDFIGVPISKEAFWEREKKRRALFYSHIFLEPLPWQLEALKRPAPFNFSKPLVKQQMVLPHTHNGIPDHLPHPILDQLVQDLGRDPLALAQFVQNEIELDLISLQKGENFFIGNPRMRNPTGTFLEGQGSPWEQCDLLIYLLRNAGFDARIMCPSPYLSFPNRFLENLFFVQLPEDKEMHIVLPGVVLQLDEQEITLYPWIKEMQIEEGHNLYSLLPESFSSADRWIESYITQDERITEQIGAYGNDTAGVLFLRFLEKELKKQNLSLHDVGTHRKICKKQFNGWEDFPRPQIKGTSNQIDLCVDHLRLISITVSSNENPSKKHSVDYPAPLLNNQPGEIAFLIRPDGRHLFRLQIGDDRTNDLNLELDETDLNLNLEITLLGDSTKTFSFAKGTHAALCAHFGRVTSKQLSWFRDAFEKEKNENKKIDRLLAFIGMAYFEKCSKTEAALAALHKLPPLTYFAVGLAKLSPDPLTGQLVFPQVDMQFCLQSQSDRDTNLQKQLAELLICDISSNEHQILLDIFQDPYAISTVKLLEIANKKEGGFLTFTPQSFKHADQMARFPLRFIAGGQWERLREIFNEPKEGHLSYAYMTPQLISNKENQPSYTGMGTLIFHPVKMAALISDNLRLMHGGFGSRLPPSFLVDAHLSPYKTGFSLLKPSDQLLSFPSFETKSPLLEQIQKTWLTADVRPGHKLGTNLVADPVDVVTGAFYVDEVDLTLPGPFPLQIRRNYSNQHPIPGVFGFGWKLGLNPYLHEEEDKLFAAEMDGTVIVYRMNGDRYEVFAEDNPELRNFGGTANPFHAYIKDNILYGTDGSKRIFKDRLLREWIDRVGNALSFDYDGEQLVKIKNSTDNFVRFHYNPEGKISEAFTKDGRWVKYHYTYQGDLDQVTLPNDAIITYTYDNNHQIIRESRPCGRVLENRYDEKGRVIEQRSPVGLQQQIVTSATFKFEEGLTTVIDGEGGTTQYLIHDKQIYKITDPVGETTYQSWFIDQRSYFDAKTGQVFFWDGPGAYPNSLKTTQDKRGLITEYFYDTSGNPISITLLGEDLTGKGDAQIEKKLRYNDLNLCIEESTLNRTNRTFYDHYLPKKTEKWVDDQLISTTFFDHNKHGQLIRQNNDGIVTRWVYKNGFPVEMTQETGTDDPDVVTTFQYNRQGQCIKKVTSGRIEAHEYDIMGNNLATSLYDLSGKLLSKTLFGYNLNNQVIWQQGPDPLNTLFIDYNAAGQVMATRQALTDGFAYTLYEYDTRSELIEDVNPLGISTYRRLDSIGRPISVTKAELTTQYTYEPGGFVASTLSPMGAKTTRSYTTNGLLKKEVYPNSTESTFVYDFFGRLAQETRNGITSIIHYDDLHQKVIRTTASVTETQHFDPRGLLIASTDGDGNTWKKTYDVLGRPKTEMSPDGQQTTWNYNGDTITCHLPSGDKITQQFECGRLLKSETFNRDGILITETQIIYDLERSIKQEISGNTITSTWFNTLGQPLKVEEGPITTLYQYDACGQCTETIDGEGYSTQFQFDPLGRLAKKILPDGSTLGYRYDDDSHLITCDLPGDLTWNASYDLMGQKTLEYLKSRNEVAQQWQYSYEKGLLQQATDPMGRTHAYSYDALSRLEKETVDQFTRSFTYDNRGLITAAEESGNDHSKVLRSYDTCGRLISESIYLNSTLIQETDQSWSPTNRILIVNGHQRDFSYESGHLKTVSSQGQSLRYDYDLSGNLVKKTTPFATVDFYYNAFLPESIITHLQDRTHTESLKWSPAGKLSSHNSKNFSYTPQGFLSQAGEEHFSFNPLGIRTSANHTSIPHDGIDAFGKIITELINSKPVKTTYDSLGQTLSSGDTSFEWDPWGRLTKATTPNSTWKASYDPFGRRLKTTHSSGWWPFPTQTLSFYDPQHEFQEIGLQSGSNTFWKIYGPNSCDLILDSQSNSVGLLNDVLGNLTAVLTSKNTSWTKELPSVYGPLTAPPTTSSLLSYAHSLTWQGKQQDPTGLIHFGARYYDPITGRFLSPDPISYPIALNLYSYTNGDPINFRDPSGRFDSPAYKTVASTAVDVFGNPYVEGGLRMHGGWREAMMGAGIVAGSIATGGIAPAIAGGIAGGYLFLNGADNVVAGAQQMYSGEYRDSFTNQVLQSFGLSSFWANVTETVLSLGSSRAAFAAKVEQNIANNTSKLVNQTAKKTSRNHFTPDINATGSHTVFRCDPGTGKVTHYETYRPQTNPRDPKPWESVVRFDGPGSDPHFNKITREKIGAPHVHDPNAPGGLRTPQPWEIP